MVLAMVSDVEDTTTSFIPSELLKIISKSSNYTIFVVRDRRLMRLNHTARSFKSLCSSQIRLYYVLALQHVVCGVILCS